MKFIKNCLFLLFKNIQSSARRVMNAILTHKKSQYHDPEEQAAILEEELTNESDLLTELTDSLGHFIKWQGPPLVKFFFSFESKATLKFFSKLLTQKVSDDLQNFALCVFVDAIEFGQLQGALRSTVLSSVVPRLVEGLGNTTKRQVCAYGLGQVRFDTRWCCWLADFYLIMNRFLAIYYL